MSPFWIVSWMLIVLILYLLTKSPLFIILEILLLTYGLYRIISHYLLPKIVNRIGAEEVDISTAAQIITSEELKAAWTSTSGATLVFYVYPTINDRTSISGNEYGSIIQIGGKQSFKILIAPDAGRGYSMAPAVFEVYMKGSSVPELIDIQDIALQRWSAVAIVRLGRKFNIYVNGKLTASHMCTAMPDFDDTQPLSTCNPRLGGKIALMSIAPYPMNSSDVRSSVKEAVNSDGEPYLSSGKTHFPFPSFELSDITDFFMCPGGNCNRPKLPGPMEEWSSPYA